MKKRTQKGITIALCAMLCAVLIIFNSTAMEAARDGFELWLNSVMPALFPFFVCTSVMTEAGLLRFISSGKRGGIGFSGCLGLFFISAVSGSPCGARMASMLYDAGMIDPRRAARVSAACNMLSPMFIVGSVGAWLASPIAALPIAIGHYAASFIALLFSVFYKRDAGTVSGGTLKSPAFRPLPSLSRALTDGTMAMVRICGTIVFFMVLSRLAETMGVFRAIAAPFGALGIKPGVISSLVMGGLEAVGGAAAIAEVSGISMALKCALCAFVLTFGGVCILAQSLPFVNVSASKYLFQKLWTAVIAGIIAYAAARLLLPDSVATIGEITEDINVLRTNAVNAAGICVSSVLSLGAAGLVSFVFSKRHSGR